MVILCSYCACTLCTQCREGEYYDHTDIILNDPKHGLSGNTGTAVWVRRVEVGVKLLYLVDSLSAIIIPSQTHDALLHCLLPSCAQFFGAPGKSRYILNFRKFLSDCGLDCDSLSGIVAWVASL